MTKTTSSRIFWSILLLPLESTYRGLRCRGIVLISLLVGVVTGGGYEQPVHAWMGAQSVMKALVFLQPYLIDPSQVELFPDFGELVGNAGRYDSFATLSLCQADSHTGVGANDGDTVIEGMVEEDDVDNWVVRPVDIRIVDDKRRAFQHFWRPDSSPYAALPLAGLSNESALQKAQALWWRALEVYPSDKPHAYWYLGRVGHLLQDMASPAHVHLDAHLPESTDVSGDSYERWTQFEDNYKRITYQSANTEIPDVLLLPDPPFSTPACWDRNLTRLFWNLAMFTRGFDSDDSNDSLVHHGRFNSYYASAQVSPSDIGLLGSLYTHFAL